MCIAVSDEPSAHGQRVTWNKPSGLGYLAHAQGLQLRKFLREHGEPVKRRDVRRALGVTEARLDTAVRWIRGQADLTGFTYDIANNTLFYDDSEEEWDRKARWYREAPHCTGIERQYGRPCEMPVRYMAEDGLCSRHAPPQVTGHAAVSRGR